MVKVYTSNSCPWCDKVKKYLTSKGVLYEEINVSEDLVAREEMISISGQMSVPVINNDGLIVVGFNKDMIDVILE